MQFRESTVGDYRIFAGALEAPRGVGYTASVVVQRFRGVSGPPREAFRDEGVACGHCWATADEALAYALAKAQDAIRRQSGAMTS
jgi:hypothetical protein